jgi:hypothetical protein
MNILPFVRGLNISAVVLCITAIFLIFCLSPGIIRQTLTCVVFIFPVLGMALLVTSVVLLWRWHRLFQIRNSC